MRLERIRCKKCGRWIVDVTREPDDGMAWPDRWRTSRSYRRGPDTWYWDRSSALLVRCENCDAWTTVDAAL